MALNQFQVGIINYYFCCATHSIHFISFDNLDSGLIYFAHKATYLGPIPGTSTSGSTVGFNENATLPFQPGKTYRLRIINTSAFAAFFFYIDGHEMSIIEVDGVSQKIHINPFVGAHFTLSLCRLTLRNHL
jgi:hypothetical protein